MNADSLKKRSYKAKDKRETSKDDESSHGEHRKSTKHSLPDFMYGVNVLFHNVEETHRKQLTRYLVAYPLISIFICFESACSSFLLRRKVLLEHNSHLSDILWTLPKMANNTKNSSEGKISPRMPSTPGWDTDRF